MAHMNIPTVVISQHKREMTHTFAQEQNGFIQLGLYHAGETEKTVALTLETLIRDSEKRRKLFDRLIPYQFIENKQKVVKQILGLIES